MSFESKFTFSRQDQEGKAVENFNMYLASAESAQRRNETAPGKIQLIRKRLEEHFNEMVEFGLLPDDDERVERTGQLISWLDKRREELL